MNRRVLEVVIEETPSEPPRRGPEDLAIAGEVSRVAALAESDSDDPNIELDGDPTLIRSRREAQELREYLLREQQLREERLREQQLREARLREEQLREQRLREEQLREEQSSVQHHGERPSAPRAVAMQPTLLGSRPEPHASANDAMFYDSEDDVALSGSGRARGGRAWLVMSAFGVVVALGGFVLLWGQSSRRPSQGPALGKVPPVVALPAQAARIPAMRLDMVGEVEAPEAHTEAALAEPQELSAPVLAALAQAEATAFGAAPEQGAPTKSDEPALVARAEGILRSDRGADGALQARELLERAIAQHGDNPHAHAALAEACLRLRAAACARTAATRAVRLRPKREAYLLLEAKVQEAFPTP